MPEPQLKPPFLSIIPPKPSLFHDENFAGEPFTADLLAGEPFTADLLSGEPFVADLLAGELVTPSPHKVVACEADGSVKFGQDEGSAYLFDPNIYTDGRISVQGIDAVLFPLPPPPPAPPPDQALPPDAALRLSSSAASPGEPEDYEPPFFRCCAENEAISSWTKNPLNMENGNVNSKHLVLTLKVKSVLDPCEEDNGDVPEDEEMNLGDDSIQEYDSSSDSEKVAGVVDDLPLGLYDKYLFCQSPVDMNNDIAAQGLIQFAENYAKKGIV